MMKEKINLDDLQESDSAINNASDANQSGVETEENSDAHVKSEEELPLPAKSKFPSMGDIFALFGIYVFIHICASVILVFFKIDTSDVAMSPRVVGFYKAMIFLAALSATIISFLIYRAIKGGKGKLVRLSSRGFNPTLLLWGIILMAAISVVIEPLFNLDIFTMPEVGIGRGVWAIFALCIVAPIFEEFICRGFILESLRSKYGVWIAILVSSIFFALMHSSNPILVINAFFMGIVLAFVYVQSGSIFAPMILHAINNGIAYIVLISGGKNIMLTEIMKNHKVGYVIIYIISAAVCILSGYVISRVMYKLRLEEKKTVVE